MISCDSWKGSLGHSSENKANENLLNSWEQYFCLSQIKFGI